MIAHPGSPNRVRVGRVTSLARPRASAAQPVSRRVHLGRAMSLAIALSCVLTAASAAEPLPRRAHVARALAAVRALGPAGCEALDRALYAAARTRCHADTAQPGVSCLVAAARAACDGAPDRKRCEAVADVAVTNLRAGTALIEEATRIRLARGSADYRAALAAELHRRYAVLAAELIVGGAGAASGPRGDGDDAGAIDEVCANRDRVLHACQPGDAACVPSLPWSRCVAALVWFVGGAP
jgi:hypothetical protein